jgi:hypothetical protein
MVVVADDTTTYNEYSDHNCLPVSIRQWPIQKGGAII